MAEGSPQRQVKIVGLLLVLLLVAVALLVVRGLQRSTAREDCLMQGRTDCNPAIGVTQ